MIKLEEAQVQYNTFISEFDSLMLATVDENGFPNASYTPFVESSDKKFYIYISTMSVHTRNLKNNAKLSVMFIEDEGKSKQIFARRRLTFTCKVNELKFQSHEFEVGFQLLYKKFGALVNNFKEMADFSIFELTPTDGRFVIGFGAAYQISNDNLEKLVHLSGGGHGHHKRSGNENASLDEVKQGMIEHMNHDHADAVVNITKFFANIENIDKAVLKDVKEKVLLVDVTYQDLLTTVEVPLVEEIKNGSDAHRVLIQMSKKSRENVSVSAK